jgi:hypothetical protein
MVNLKLFENGMLRRIFGGQGVKGDGENCLLWSFMIRTLHCDIRVLNQGE